MVLAPHLIGARFVAVAVKAPGTVAIAYLGTADGTKFDGYIAETTDAFDPAPTFWSSAVSYSADPLYPSGFVSGYDGSYFNNGGDGVEFVQVKYAPSGDIWASFVKDMCKTATSGCSWDYAASRQLAFPGSRGPARSPALMGARRSIDATPNCRRPRRGFVSNDTASRDSIGTGRAACAGLASSLREAMIDFRVMRRGRWWSLRSRAAVRRLTAPRARSTQVRGGPGRSTRAAAAATDGGPLAPRPADTGPLRRHPERRLRSRIRRGLRRRHVALLADERRRLGQPRARDLRGRRNVDPFGVLGPDPRVRRERLERLVRVPQGRVPDGLHGFCRRTTCIAEIARTSAECSASARAGGASAASRT